MERSGQKDPQRVLLDQYAKARRTLETSKAALRSCLGPMMPDNLTQSFDLYIKELDMLEKATISLLSGYSFSGTALAHSHLLSEVLNRSIKTFEICEDGSKGRVTFCSLTISLPSASGGGGLVGGDRGANIDQTIDSLSQSLHDIILDHNGLHRLIQREKKYPQLQETVDRYYWAQRALMEAFTAKPFKLTHKGVEEALDRYYNLGAAANASGRQARQRFFARQDTIVHPLIPAATLKIIEDEIWKRTELPPKVDLAVLNHHCLIPVNDVDDSANAQSTTDMQNLDESQATNTQDTTDIASATQPPGTIRAQNTNNTPNITDGMWTRKMHHCFSSMEKKGADWIKSQSSNALPGTVGILCSVEDTVLETKTICGITEAGPANESECILRRNLYGAIAAAKKAKESALHQCRRIAVIGGASHGKTSFLNELIGEQILYTDGRATTSWPFIIRHDPLAVIPELNISESHFQPFLKDIAEFRPSVYFDDIKQKTKPSQTEKNALNRWESFQKENTTFKQDIANWESKGYTFPTRTSEVEAINQMNIRIGQLIRIWYLCGLRKNQSFNDEAWPTLTVDMKNLSKETRSMRIEFVDLPGYGDTTVLKEDVVACWKAVIKNSHGVIFVYKAEKITLDKEETLTVMMSINDMCTQPNRPIITIGTHLDQHTGDSWDPSVSMEFFGWLWPDRTQEMIEKRTATVSNVLHLSAPVVIRRIKSRVEFEYDVLAEGLGGIAMSKWMDKTAASHLWPNVKPETVITGMEDLITRSKFQHAVGKVHLLALSAAKRQLKPQLSDALMHFRNVQHSNSTLLSMARKKTQELEDMARRYEEFAKNVIDFCSKWWEDRKKFATERKANMEKLASDAMSEAQNLFTSQIQHLIIQQRVGFSDQNLVFSDREKATEFIQKLQSDLRNNLHKIQLTSVVQVCHQLTKDWEDRVLQLKNYFTTMDTESVEESLRETIYNHITRHLSLSNSPIEDILSRLICKETSSTDSGSKIPDVPYLRARSKAEKIYQNDISGGPSTIPEAEGKPLCIDTIANAVNIVGVLGRPSVLATPPNFDLHPWEFLTEESAQDPIEIEQAEVQKTYMETTIRKWHQIVRNEWLDSTDGVVELCSAIGLSIVMDDLRTYRAHLKKKRKAEEAKNMPGDEFPSLILAQANCSALVGAYEGLLEECARDDLDIDPPPNHT
ncbi:hypothetical protein FRB91_006324 [Serendipita sp. 411]|nr:hypothetical protein FRB91_006324 [Serendipita sp. 411]